MSEIGWGNLPEARQLARLGKSLSRVAQGRLQWMLFYVFHGRNAARTCRRFAISRQTFYRWKRRFNRHDLSTLEERSHRPRSVRQPTWAPALAERVLSLRQQYPRWGKDKLVVLLAREKCRISTSMVGRILVYWKGRGMLHEPPKPALLRQARRKLRKRPWAIRMPKYWPIEQPGDLVEIDTKEIRMRRGLILKHFSAPRRSLALGCRRGAWPRGVPRGGAVSKSLVGSRALCGQALQVDGGSEFAAEFEDACQQKQLPLFVLPPKSPKLNAHVERSHRTHHEEFNQVSAASDHLPVLNDQLRRWEHTYNCVRSHQSLAYLTPLEFITRWKNNPKKAKCH